VFWFERFFLPSLLGNCDIDFVMFRHRPKWPNYMKYQSGGKLTMKLLLNLLRNQNFTKFHKISQNFTKFHKISQNFTKFHKISQNFTKFHKISRNFTKLIKPMHFVSKKAMNWYLILIKYLGISFTVLLFCVKYLGFPLSVTKHLQGLGQGTLAEAEGSVRLTSSLRLACFV
jgi:hypothetical protein